MPLLARFVTSSLALEIAYEALMDVATSEEHVDLACEVLDTLQLPPPDHSTRDLCSAASGPSRRCSNECPVPSWPFGRKTPLVRSDR
ncbi:hypothetical protein PRIPAC_97469 [Pristionchus pacificus]|uniref:Uncharacterized protein n=1 Tax=Pristionchus pacificus TaxID=54126 RepID=A0A454XLC4_PRIPA|nr:hypothetical protein PRIPAC_97469 [Pristionchus pacificus]|eukprot:PDM77440.1 hypothetical protein PRIPAC_33170 [Pristionchus pacificus]